MSGSCFSARQQLKTNYKSAQTSMTDKTRVHPEIKHSENFPPGYGDLQIETCDNIIFHFPRFLLSHASPVFKDMFEIGPDKKPEQETPLIVSEDSQAIDLLLLYIDPAKASPEFDAQTV